MICRSCGREISDGAKFCPYCGMNPAESAGSGSTWGSAPEPAGYTGPEAPVPGGGKKKGLLIAGAAAAVVVLALIAAAAAGLFANPKKQVAAAFAKSAAAYAAVEEKLGLPDVAQWRRDQSIFQSISLQLRDINSQLTGYDLSALSGLEFGMSAGYSGEDRYMLAEAAASWGPDELFLFRMVADDAELYFHSPQFTGDAYYGVNTETLGADLTRMTGDDSMDSVSFNFFDLMELALERVDQEAMEQAVREANQALWQVAQVKKAGTRTLTQNGAETKSTLYHVTVPQEALEQYVDDMETMLSLINYFDLYEELYQSMGMPQDQIDEILDMLENLDIYGELADGLRDVLDDLGSLELDVCLCDGYVSAILFEDEIYGSDVSLTLYLGGNGAYVDNLSAKFSVEDTEIALESSGSHAMDGQVYTDKTTIRLRQSGTAVARITSELSYDPREDEENFQWDLEVNSSGLSIFSLDTQGTLYVEEDIIDLTLDDAVLRVMGIELCSLHFNCRASRCPDWLEQPMEKARLITGMDQAELTAFANELQNNAEAWVEDMEALFLARLPQELLWAVMYA